MNSNINFCKVKFQNPIVLASGILGMTGSSLAETVRNGCGGVTTKSIWAKAHIGHSNPTVIAKQEWMMNAVGLPDGGVEKAKDEIKTYRKQSNAPLIASIVGGKTEDYLEIAEKIIEFKPDIIEINASCPNVEDELGKPFACSIINVAKLTTEVKKIVKDIPVSVKLSPNVENISEIAKSCQNAGADALTVVNTFGPGITIDINVRKPVLKNKVGGVSGPGIFPLALKCVWDCYQATKLPIIGTGGITTGDDALQMIMAGANLLGVGSAVYYRGNDVFQKINDEIQEYMTTHNIDNLSDLIGVAHS